MSSQLSPQVQTLAGEGQLRSGVYERLGSILSAMASPVRLKIVQALAQSPRSVEELSNLTGESVANTSQHLQRMAKEGVVTAKKSGLTRIYRIGAPGVLTLWEALQDLGGDLSMELKLAEDQLADATLLSDLSAEAIMESVRERKAVLLDVRDPVESRATPVPMSVSVPLQGLPEYLKKLPVRKSVYVFCRGRYCSMASKAVRILRDRGLKAYRLKESTFRLNEITGRDA